MAVVKADGFGHGAVDVARTALAARRDLGSASPALDEALAAARGGSRRAGAQLAQPGRRRLRAPPSRTTSRSPSRAVAHLDAVAPAGRRRRRGCTCTLDAGHGPRRRGPRRLARPVPRRPAAERAGRWSRVVGLMGHLGLRRRPGRPGQRRAAGPASPGRSRPPARPGCGRRERHLAATAATLTDPRSHHTMSRVGAGLVGIDPSGTDPRCARR